MIIDAAELKQRYLQRIAGVRDHQVYIGPEIVTLELTNVCNLRCQYCITDHSPGNPAHFDKARFLSWEKFVEIVRDCVELKVDQITLIGSGEPTMHPSFREMMRHLEQQPIRVVLVTNGAFDLDYCSDVIKGDHVVVNLGAVDQEQYRLLQGKDFFDRVIANIKRLVALRNTMKPGFHIEIDYVMNMMNIHQKQRMQELVAELGVNSVFFKKMKVHEYNQSVAIPEDLKTEAEYEEIIFPPSSLNGWFYILVGTEGNFDPFYQIPEGSLGGFDKYSLKDFWLSTQMMKLRLLGKNGQIRAFERQFRLNHQLVDQ